MSEVDHYRCIHPVVLGCPRSGTSILGEVVEALGYHYLPEPHMPFGHVKGLAIKNPWSGNPNTGLSFNWSAISGVFPGDCYFKPIWIVRHPLDVAASMRNWLPKARALNLRMVTDEDSTDEMEVAANVWLKANTEGWSSSRSYLQRRTTAPDFATIVYERLCADPLPIVGALGSFLGMKVTDQTLDVVEKISEQTGGYEAQIQRHLTTHDHSTHVGRWRQNLSEQEAETVWSITGDVATTFGYTRDGLR